MKILGAFIAIFGAVYLISQAFFIFLNVSELERCGMLVAQAEQNEYNKMFYITERENKTCITHGIHIDAPVK